MVNNKKSSVKSPMEKLLGPTLLTKVGSSATTDTVLKGKDLVLLYFSASWCPPCKKFTPVLTRFYTDCCVPNNVEIVYISSDSDVPSFEGYYGKMPWASIPAAQGTAAIKQALSTSLKIQGIPSLIVLDTKTGHFVNNSARFDVSNADGNTEKGKEMISSWKGTDAVPFDQADLGSGPAGGGILARIIQLIAKHPMYLFGLYFMIRKGIKYLEDLGNEEEDEL